MPQIPFRGKPLADRFMEPEEFHRVAAAAAADPDAHRLLVVLGHGLRTVEAVGLRVHDLDIAKGGLWVRTAKRKDGHVRFVLLGRFLPLFEAAARRRAGDEALLTRRGKPFTRRAARYLFHLFKQRAGIRHALGPHSLRHLAAIILTESGAQPQEVAAFLGHKDLNSVLIYFQLRHERARQLGAALSSGLAGADTKPP